MSLGIVRPSEPESFRMPRRRLIAPTIGGLWFTGMGIASVLRALLDKSEKSPGLLIGFGYALLFLGGMGLVAGVAALIRNPVLIRISESGFEDNCRGDSVGFIEWGQIAKTEVRSILGEPTLLIFLADPQQMVGRLKGAKLQRAQYNMQKYKTPVVIPRKMSPISIEELHRKIEMRLPETSRFSEAPTKPKLPWKKY